MQSINLLEAILEHLDTHYIVEVGCGKHPVATEIQDLHNAHFTRYLIRSKVICVDPKNKPEENLPQIVYMPNRIETAIAKIDAPRLLLCYHSHHNRKALIKTGKISDKDVIIDVPCGCGWQKPNLRTAEKVRDFYTNFGFYAFNQDIYFDPESNGKDDVIIASKSDFLWLLGNKWARFDYEDMLLANPKLLGEGYNG